jgi:hypothetical protein
LLDRVMIASLDLLSTELGKPALDLIDQRTVGWGKVQVVARLVPEGRSKRLSDPSGGKGGRAKA